MARVTEMEGILSNQPTRQGTIGAAARWRHRLLLSLLAVMVTAQCVLALSASPQAALTYLRLSLGLPEMGGPASPQAAVLHPLPKIKPDMSRVVPVSLPPADQKPWHADLQLSPVGLQVLAGPDSGMALVHDVDALNKKFASLGYDLGAVRSGAGTVPHAYLEALPKDMPRIRSAKVRKRAFIKLMLPLVLRANAAVRVQRQRLLDLAARLREGKTLAAEDARWVGRLADAYGVETGDGVTLVEALPQLERRVDVVPPSLAIAQSAEESGWGTSRFAVLGNAVYGQWSWRKGSGIVPKGRDEGEKHEVRAFRSLQSSVNAYLRNLNTHWAYKVFREKRVALRREGQAVDSHHLIDTLTSYSERGTEYVETLRTIIRVNRLEELDTARLNTAAKVETRL
jgi:Bax protein